MKRKAIMKVAPVQPKEMGERITCSVTEDTLILDCYRDTVYLGRHGITRTGEHELKIYPKYFDDVISGKRRLRSERMIGNFFVGDVLLLKERDNFKYSGREAKVEVIYLLDDKFIGI